MNVEQQLIDAFSAADRIEPSDDLWSRVVHSIDEDRAHRRRVTRTIVTVAAVIAGLSLAGALSVQVGPFGRFVHRPTMEILEVVALATLLLTLGPALRRFGRGYATDLWPDGSTTPTALLRLLDLAYYLVGAGYILLSTQFEFADELLSDRLADQLEGGGVRIGGLLLLLGGLHASTLFALPIVALVDNATRAGRRLPRWLIVVVIVLAGGVFLVVQAAVGVGLLGGS